MQAHLSQFKFRAQMSTYFHSVCAWCFHHHKTVLVYFIGLYQDLRDAKQESLSKINLRKLNPYYLERTNKYFFLIQSNLISFANVKPIFLK